jgi:transposase-like protein
MKKSKHTPEQIIRKLREADAQLATGATVPDLCKSLGVSEATYYRWKREYGGVRGFLRRRQRGLRGWRRYGLRPLPGRGDGRDQIGTCALTLTGTAIGDTPQERHELRVLCSGL